MANRLDRLYSVKNLKRLAWLLDDQFRVPVIGYRVGWDFIIGLIPVAGDLITALISLFILFGARHHRVSLRVRLRMLLNIGLDFLVGIVPIIGDILDASFKSNAKNIKLLLKDLESRQTASNLNISDPATY